ncbi:hypothetical protein KKH13_05345 [Patescibacteria group bacterium]|nr:hypothetical protein [Patescibacteria group bacterium]
MEDLREREIARRSLFYGTNNKKHICETLRMVHDYVYEMPDGEVKEKMTELLIDAMVMAKKMQDRLSYYQKTYKDNTGNKAINIVGLAGVRARAKMRKARA